jgi:PKD repeat protein
VRTFPRRLGLLLAVALLAAPAVVHAQLNILPPGFTSELVANPLPEVTGVAFAPDGRIFLAAKRGQVLVWENGARLDDAFIDLSDQTCDCLDRGLLGIALHPQFPQQPYVYLLYTYEPPGVPQNDDVLGGRVSRLIRVEADPAQNHNVALPGSTVPQTTPGGPGHWVMLGTNSTLANIGNPADGRDITKASCMVGLSMANPPIQDCLASDEQTHSIGTVAFGTDGSMFVSNGDGSNATGVDPRALRSQDLDSLSGKLLHIDPDTALGLEDNPFFDPLDPGSNRSKVWAYGLRNPFRMSIDPTTNEPWVGDVGWNLWEELNTGKGANFGWPCYEGGTQSGTEGWLTTSIPQPGYSTSALTNVQCGALYAQGLGAVKPPTFAWDHTSDGYQGFGGAAALAGARYTGTVYPPSFQNAFFFADYSRRWIRYLTFDAQGVTSVGNFAKATQNGVVQVFQGPDTNLYALVIGGPGDLRRIRYTAGGNTPPTAVPVASPASGAAPLDVSFTGQGSYDPDAQPLSFSWDFGDGSPLSTLENPAHTYADAGTYLATLTVTEQTAPNASGSEGVVITVGSSPPLAVIDAPIDGSTFAVGDTIVYSGSASIGGVPLDPSALTWERRMHHNEHIHFDPLPPGAGGSIPAIDHGDGVWFELCLTAMEETLTDTQCVDTLPRQTTVTVDSVPPGMHIVYEQEGIALVTPAIVEPTEGSTRTLNAPAIEQWRTFDRWSDGVTALSRSFVVGTTPLALTAEYVNQPPLANASATPQSGPDRFSVSFDAAGSSDPEGGGLAYAWDFGDGQVGSGSNPAHLYAAPGSYLATLTVTDPIGGTAQGTVQIEITNAAPEAWFSQGTTASGIAFDATASWDPDGDALAYAWDFGDGATGTGPTVTHDFVPGSYVVTLGVSDPYLATATTQREVAFGPPRPMGCGLGPELPVLLGGLLALRHACRRKQQG